MYPSDVLNLQLHVLEVTWHSPKSPLCGFMSKGGHPGQGAEMLTRLGLGEQRAGLPLLCCKLAVRITE